MKVVRLSALYTGRLYPPGNIPDIHLCQRLSRPLGHNQAGRIMSIKKFQWHHWESNPRPPGLYRSVQSIAPPRVRMSVSISFTLVTGFRGITEHSLSYHNLRNFRFVYLFKIICLFSYDFKFLIAAAPPVVLYSPHTDTQLLQPGALPTCMTT